jgi:chromosome segregation ATPase
MPRPRGSKNKRGPKADNLDALNAQIVEKLNQKSTLEQEISSLNATIADSKARLKVAHKELKKLEKNVDALESMREELGTAQMMEKAMSEIQPKITALLASGKTPEDIIEMLGE